MVGEPVHDGLVGAVGIEQLAERVRQIEHRSDPIDRDDRRPGVVRTGWPGVDRRLAGGLRRGAIHEWFADLPPPTGRAAGPIGPVCLLAHLAGQSLDDGGYIIWVGRSCWPYGRTLIRAEAMREQAMGEQAMGEQAMGEQAMRERSMGARSDGAGDRRLLVRSMLVDPPSDVARLWAIDIALRCSSVSVVVADGGGLDMAATRRLQVAARTGRTLGLLARPLCDVHRLSSATTRWRVSPVPTDGPRPRWRLQLIRCKGVARCRTRPARANDDEPWFVEWDGAKGLVVVPAKVVDRSGATPTIAAKAAVATHTSAASARRSA
jgi:hypothetical protein